MANVVLSRVFGAFYIEAFEELGLHCLEVGAFFKDVVSMKYVAQKVAIIKREIELGLDFGGDRFHPVRVFAKECDVQGEYFLGCFLMQGLIAYGRACGGKAVEQERF